MDTSSFVSRNENDSAPPLQQTTWRFIKSARRFPAEPQDFESVRRFELPSECDILRSRPKEIHKLVTFDPAGSEFSDNSLPLCR
jgi:hypothetical protein